MNQVTSTINRHSKFLIVLVIIVILLMVIFITTRLSQPASQIPESIPTPDSIESPYGVLIENTNNIQIEYSGKKLIVPEGWVIDSVYQNKAESDNLCITEDEKECKIYSISNGSQKYFISIPLGLRYQNGPAFESKPMNINFAGEDIEFTAERLLMQTRSDDSENGESEDIENSGMYLQIYGCNSIRFCASTSMLDFANAQANAKQIQDFKTLISQMTIR